MKAKDPAVTFSNPRLLSAIYFGILSVVATLLINAFLNILGLAQDAPLFQSVLWGMIIASITGAIFGKYIVQCPEPYRLKTFLTGFFMVLLSLPFFVLGVAMLMRSSDTSLWQLTTWHNFYFVFIIMLGYSYLLFGFLLAIAAGLAAMYLRGSFVGHVLHTNDDPELQRLADIEEPKKNDDHQIH